jgi:hypothetical protein
MFRNIQHPGFAVPREIPAPYPLPFNLPAPVSFDPANYPAFLETIGLVGMGGGMFPAGRKVRSSHGIHTLVINGVECEPGITIDQAVLLYHARWIIESPLNPCRGEKRLLL